MNKTKKNILVISQYFWPENFHINEVCLQLKKLGHNVQVLTAHPNYPNGQIYKSYIKNKPHIQNYNNIKVYRVPIIPRKKSTFSNLLKNYISFIFSATYYGLKFKYDKFDKILFYGTSPITSAIPAIIIKLIYRKKIIIWVQDLWPQSVSATGYLNNKYVLKIIDQLIKVIYFFSDKILIQSKSFQKYILNQTSKDKIIYHPNSFKRPIKKIKLLKKHKNLLDKNFCITFAGNIGKAQNLETLLNAFKYIKKYKKIKILICGDGSEKKKLQKVTKKNNLKNVYFLGSFSQSYIFQVYKKSKALFVSLKDDEVLNLTIPNKVQSYLSAGKPIIGSISGATKKLIINKKIGFCTPPSNERKLKEIILRLYQLNKSDIQKMEINSLRYYENNFDFFKLNEKLSKIINSNV